MKMDLQFQKERGSVTVLTVTIVLFAAIVALVLADLLGVLASKSRAQTAADAAALAAAQEIARPSGTQPSAMAADYARRNGAILIGCECDGDAASAVVTVELPVKVIFVGADRHVRARAKAAVETSGPS